MLLVLLAAMAIMGTPLPAEKAETLFVEKFGPGLLPVARLFGLVDTYHSPLFVSLLVLLAVNISFCTWHRFSLYRKYAAKKTGRSGRGLRVTLDVLLHLSVIVILLGGAAKGLLATVGTQYLFLGVGTDTFYDWDVKADVPLGFTLHMKESVKDYYPLELRVGVSEAATGESLALLEVREGKSIGLPGGDLELSVGEYDIDAQWITIRAKGAGWSETARLDTVPGGRTSTTFRRYGLTLVGWRRNLKRVRGRVAVLDGGEQMKEQWLAPNGRIGYSGTSIFLTAWGEDEYGNSYLGIQVTRDPGAVVFWIGATLLCVTLPLFMAARHMRRPLY